MPDETPVMTTCFMGDLSNGSSRVTLTDRYYVSTAISASANGSVPVPATHGAKAFHISYESQ